MKLTADNYFSAEANQAFLSATFIKNFLKCEAAAIAELSGEYQRKPSQALMVGSYVDAYFEGKMLSFAENHPEIFKRDGTLKTEYVKANEMITRAESDPVFMSYMEGDKQCILTGNIDGMPFKAKLDVYRQGERIVDLKTTKDMEPQYLPEQGRVSFAEYWNWPLQLAIYQQLEGHKLPCYLAVITKESPPDIAIIEIPQEIMDVELAALRQKLPYIDAVRKGIVEPKRCGKCAYCRASKKLNGAISLTDFIEN